MASEAARLLSDLLAAINGNRHRRLIEGDARAVAGAIVKVEALIEARDRLAQAENKYHAQNATIRRLRDELADREATIRRYEFRYEWVKDLGVLKALTDAEVDQFLAAASAEDPARVARIRKLFLDKLAAARRVGGE